jgi:hypothetical protein
VVVSLLQNGTEAVSTLQENLGSVGCRAADKRERMR